MREFKPIPDPSGALQPPRRTPPTAVGAATPEPEPERRPAIVRHGRRQRSPVERMLRLAVGLPLLGLELGARAVRRLVHR